MIDVQVTVDGIILFCDESVAMLNLGRGYTIQKVYFDDMSFKNKITDGNGHLVISYLGSRLCDERGIYFMCLHKQDNYQIQGPQIQPGIVITGQDTMCEEQISEYKDTEVRFLNRIISLLHLYKKGNIGCKEIFFEHHFTFMGFINNTQRQTNDSVTKNIVDARLFSLTENEVTQCNQFIQDYSGLEYDLLQDSIEEFVWGLEQVDIPTGFEQYTTALEMILLSKNQDGKKEVLSNRVSVPLESDPVKIKNLYNRMKNFYRYRSESLHEGDGRNITQSELEEMEDIVRSVIIKYLGFCKQALQANPTTTWGTIKREKINDIKNSVAMAKNAGILPV